jgi:hypothetical protein
MATPCGWSRFSLITVAKEELELQLGVRGIILGLARGEGLAILGQRGIDREQDQKVVLLQGIDEGALGKLEAHGNGPPLEALSQCTRPRLDGIGAVGQDAGLSPSGVGCLQADIVFGIGPIDADEGGEVVACRLRQSIPIEV